MQIKLKLFNRALLTTFLLLFCAITGSTMNTERTEQNEKLKQREKVIELHKKGDAVRKRERASLNDTRLAKERREIFEQAILALTEYMQK